MTPAPLPKTMTYGDLAKRIGELLILGLQSGDHETRHAAAVSSDELSWTKDGGPRFTPIERLTEENERLRKALESIRDMKPREVAPETFPGLVHGPKLLFDNCQRIARSALTPTDTEESRRGKRNDNRL